MVEAPSRPVNLVPAGLKLVPAFIGNPTGERIADFFAEFTFSINCSRAAARTFCAFAFLSDSLLSPSSLIDRSATESSSIFSRLGVLLEVVCAVVGVEEEDMASY